MKVNGQYPHKNQDINVATLRARDPAVDKAMDEVSKGMEEQFAHLLIKEMKKSAPKTEESGSAMNIYESFLDDEYAKILAEKKSLGISDTVKQQLLRQYEHNIRGQHE